MSIFERLVSLIKPRTIHDEMTSVRLRDKFRERYGVEVGLYTYGCFDPKRIQRQTSFGRYCSISTTVWVYTRNHGIEFISTTPYLYNAALGMIEKDSLPFHTVVVEDDVWMGHNAIILPNAGTIGRGSVIAAGAVVTRPVEPYTIVAGNPARPLRSRFNDAVIERIERLRWWEWDLQTFEIELARKPDLFFKPNLLLGRGA